MGVLRWALLLAAFAASSPAAADEVDRWRGPVTEASQRFGIPALWIEQVMRAESGGKTMLWGRPTVSSAGAMGLMQLMPGTWREVRARLGLGNDPHDPRDNILAGTFYLRLLYDQFGYPGVFAAYNAGPARFAQHRMGGRPLPAETRAYVASIAGSLGREEPVVGGAARSAAREVAPLGGSSLFFGRGAGGTGLGAPHGGLFILLSDQAAAGTGDRTLAGEVASAGSLGNGRPSSAEASAR